jgi:3-hydroxypropanoate dehydrogenase
MYGSQLMNSTLLASGATALDENALATLFSEARTPNGFRELSVSDELLERIVSFAHLGATAINSTPLRVVFVKTPEGKSRLLSALSTGNVEKTMQAPVTAILAHDRRFYEHLATLFPHRDMSHIGNNETASADMALYNATLQAGYFILAARALGLDAGPMGGFDKSTVDREFFQDGSVKSDLLVNLGYGDEAKLFPRNPRLRFENVASYV